MNDIATPITLQPQAVNAIFNYLAKRPWDEVNHLIVALATAANASSAEPRISDPTLQERSAGVSARDDA